MRALVLLTLLAGCASTPVHPVYGGCRIYRWSGILETDRDGNILRCDHCRCVDPEPTIRRVSEGGAI